jgi:hypothetical protein
MSTQTLNNKSEYIIPDIATKIKNLSATKLVLLKMIIDMYPMSNDPIFSVYAGPLIKLLQSIINIHKNVILLELEDGLTSTLVTYIFDINELIKGHLNLEKYEPRHKNLVAVHQKIDYYLNHYDPQGLEELKAILFLI